MRKNLFRLTFSYSDDKFLGPVFIFFTGDVQIVVQIVLDKGGNVSAYKSPSQETIKVILSPFNVVVIFWQNRMITLTYTIKIFFKPFVNVWCANAEGIFTISTIVLGTNPAVISTNSIMGLGADSVVVSTIFTLTVERQ